MTNEEMTQATLNHWRMYYPAEYRALGKEQALAEATACAALTRSEMNAIKMVNPGMADEEAWAEARSLFCMTPPPEIQEETPPEEEQPKTPRSPEFLSSAWTPEQVQKAEALKAYIKESYRKKAAKAKKNSQ
jgi:hypothetical protein